ncbi:restriction endonuclease subunit S [Streptomyces sparsogenes]|nr:restriction endonuclease subunit S [Streptomyces sparsogenes]
MRELDWVPLSDLVQVNPRPRPSGDTVPYVGMEDVSNDGQLLRVTERAATSVSAGQPSFEDDDILFAKITPCMENGKGAYVAGLNGRVAYGSTEFHVLRAHPGVHAKFIHHWTMTREFRRKAESMMTGTGGQRRVPADFFTRLQVPLLSFDHQRRIARALDTITESEQAISASIRKLHLSRHASIESMLSEMYSTAPLISLSEVAEVERGKFSARPRNDPSYFGGEYCFIQTGDITQANGNVITDASQHLNSRGLKVSREFPPGTVAVTIAANIGETAILGKSMCFPDSVVGVSPHEGFESRFLERCINRFQPLLEAQAPQSAQKNINLQHLRPLPIPHVPINKQRYFLSVWEGYERRLLFASRELAKLHKLKGGLADDLLTGKVRFSGSS